MMKHRWLAVGCVALVVALTVTGLHLVSEISHNRYAAQSCTCHGHLKSIATAMLHYHERYGHFPPAYLVDKHGKPAHSWRVLLLEYLDPGTYGAYRFDEPWDGPNNRKLEDKMLSCYACPADTKRGRWETNYFVIVGPNTVFPGSNTVKVDDITRPHAETILVVEAVDQGIHWMEPRDLELDRMSFAVNDAKKPSISCRHNRPPGVAAVDGTVFSLTNIRGEQLRQMVLIVEAAK